MVCWGQGEVTTRLPPGDSRQEPCLSSTYKRTWQLLAGSAEETAGLNGVDRKLEVTVKGPGGHASQRAQRNQEKKGPRRETSVPGTSAQAWEAGGREAHSPGGGGFSYTCGNFRWAGHHLYVSLFLQGWEALSWEPGCLLRGPLNWGRRGREGTVWG